MDQPASLNCPACGAPLDFDGTSAVVRCKFCGNVSLIPGVSPAKTAVPDSALDEIRQLAGSGKLIEAIKRYREIYGVGLAEAKDGVEALQAGRLATPSAPGAPAPEQLTKVLEQVQQLLKTGNKIEAIKIYRQNYDVSLARAKYAVEQIEAGRTTWPEAGFPTPEAPAEKPSSTSRSGNWLGCGITAAIILFMAGILTVVFLQPGGPLNRHYIVNGPAVLIPSEQGTTADFALLLYNPDRDTRFIGLVDGAIGKLRWQAPALSGDGYADAIVAGTDLVYAANDTDLLAYHTADGTLAWQAEMPDKLNYGTSTMLVASGRVITDNTDQSIQAYDAGTGSLVWSRRLDGYDRVLRLMGNSLVLIDYVDSNYNFSLIFLDPVTGSQQRVITPICTHQDYSFDALDPGAGLAYDPAENALYLVFDASYACAMRLDLASGQTTWQVTGDESFSFVPDGFQSLMTDSTLYFSNGNDLLVVDKSSGAMKVLLTNPDYDLLPLAVTGDMLLVRARRTRGSERFALWGVNAVSGEPVWQKDLQDAQPIDPPDEMAGLVDDTDWGWTWKLVPNGLTLITFQGEPNQVVLEGINPADGTGQGQQALALKKVSGDFYSIPTIIGWQGSLGYIHLETGIYMLDLSTGQLKSIY
jgi:ribosomal protein L7/L12/outer membrane protein assembly factor BamB